MAFASAPAFEGEQTPTAPQPGVDACRQAAHLSHELHLLKSVAQDAVEDGVYAASRSVTSLKRRLERLEDLKDEAVHRVRRRPLQAVNVGVGVGLAIGLAVGWIVNRRRRSE